MTPRSPQIEYIADGVIFAQHSHSLSVDYQISCCHAYAESKGIKVLKVYADCSINTSNKNRPELQRMIQDVKKMQWRYVIVYAPNCIARDRYEYSSCKLNLKHYGVDILSATSNEPNDLSIPLLDNILEGLFKYFPADTTCMEETYPSSEDDRFSTETH